MLTITLLLVLAAFVLTLLSGMGKPWLWIAVLLLCIVHLLALIPR